MRTAIRTVNWTYQYSNETFTSHGISQFSTTNYTAFLILGFEPKVWFFCSKVIFILYNNLLVELKISSSTCDFLFHGAFRHGWFGMCPPSCVLLMYQYKPTSHATSIKKLPSEQLWLGINIFCIGLVDYSTVGFSQLQGGTNFYTVCTLVYSK